MSDLTTEEQTNVRTALRFLRLQSGGWKMLAKALHCDHKQLCKVGAGRGGVSASLAFRVARLAGVPVDDVLAGRYPGEGTCPYCGHREDASSM
jgi:hypothetical protein